jgi:quinolinate synthase
MGLFDMILVKDNHVDAAAGLADAVKAVRRANPDLPVEIEVRDLAELEQVLTIEPYPDRVMLDNMDVASLREAVDLVNGRFPLEASGGVSLASVGAIAATGIDAISVGAMTHSATAFDFSMKTATPAVTRDSLMQRAQRLKRDLFDRITVLGHHYQRDEIIELSDLSGDSLGLARDAAASDTEFIIFCGVHFMAETAAILANPGQHVLLPDMQAGCYLADTASPDSVEEAWGRLDAALGGADGQVVPVTYVNSSAELKAFCGRHGGTVCTSGNAEAILRWAFEQGPRVLFFPDQHLGRNTGHRLGVSDDQMLLLNADASVDTISSARMFLWPGACNVHRRFRPEHLSAIRQRHPDARIIVHPECTSGVVRQADDDGSTAHIIRCISQAAPGTTWAIGTEARLVRRLAGQFPDKKVVPLSLVPAYCSTMSQITLDKLVGVFEAIQEGRPYNEVTVQPEVSRWARVALERMLDQS